MKDIIKRHIQRKDDTTITSLARLMGVNKDVLKRYLNGERRSKPIESAFVRYAEENNIKIPEQNTNKPARPRMPCSRCASSERCTISHNCKEYQKYLDDKNGLVLYNETKTTR